MQSSPTDGVASRPAPMRRRRRRICHLDITTFRQINNWSNRSAVYIIILLSYTHAHLPMTSFVVVFVFIRVRIATNDFNNIITIRVAYTYLFLYTLQVSQDPIVSRNNNNPINRPTTDNDFDFSLILRTWSAMMILQWSKIKI